MAAPCSTAGEAPDITLHASLSALCMFAMYADLSFVPPSLLACCRPATLQFLSLPPLQGLFAASKGGAVGSHYAG